MKSTQIFRSESLPPLQGKETSFGNATKAAVAHDPADAVTFEDPQTRKIKQFADGTRGQQTALATAMSQAVQTANSKLAKRAHRVDMSDVRVSELRDEGQQRIFMGATLKAGSFAKFHQGCTEDGRKVAIKVLLVESKDGKPNPRFTTDMTKAFAEIDAMKLCGARITHHGIVTHDNKLYVIMDLFDGDLSQIQALESSEKSRPPIAERALGEVAGDLARCHKSLRVHGDVTPENVFWKVDATIALGDYGQAAEIDPGTQKAPPSTSCLLSYSAPERVRGETYGPAADMWSLGATLLSVVTRINLFALSGSTQGMNKLEIAMMAIAQVREAHEGFKNWHQKAPRMPNGDIDMDTVVHLAEDLSCDALTDIMAGAYLKSPKLTAFIANKLMHPDPNKRATATEAEAFGKALQETSPDQETKTRATFGLVSKLDKKRAAQAQVLSAYQKIATGTGGFATKDETP